MLTLLDEGGDGLLNSDLASAVDVLRRAAEALEQPGSPEKPSSPGCELLPSLDRLPAPCLQCLAQQQADHRGAVSLLLGGQRVDLG
jgi:hypothetical protein